MPRKSRPLNRDSGAVRDASLMVIASEDTFAVKDYFSRFKTRRVQLEVLHTQDCRSSPRDVMARLDEFKKEYLTVDGDSFWLCIDRDRWQLDHLEDVLRQCIAKGYGIVLSNPCFELWILLHFEETTLERCRDAKSRLQELLGGYGKQCCRTMQVTEVMVRAAMERARAMGTDAGELVPAAPHTHVYKILDKLIVDKDRIVFV